MTDIAANFAIPQNASALFQKSLVEATAIPTASKLGWQRVGYSTDTTTVCSSCSAVLMLQTA